MRELWEKKILVFGIFLFGIVLGLGMFFIYEEYIKEKESITVEEENLNIPDYSSFLTESFSHKVTIFGQNETFPKEYVEVNNEIMIPKDWSYEKYPNFDGEYLSGSSNITIKDPESKISLNIEPLIDNECLPVQINFGQKIGKQEYQSFLESNVKREVTIIRNKVSEDFYVYTQVFTESDIEYSSKFFVYSKNEDTSIWSAQVYIRFSDVENLSSSEIKDLIYTTDAIVLSLRAL